jgi:GR25 family glycosyltransferase involved in LPS biosynthesis
MRAVKSSLAFLARVPFYFFHAGFTSLAIRLQSLFMKIDPKPERVRALNFFRNGARLRAMRWEGRQEYPVYVINREKDSDRLRRFRKSCAKWGVEFERVEAINCADPGFDFAPYDSQIAETFYGKTDFLRGAVGCFLSHAKAWRVLVDSNHSHAMICEDDVRFLGPIPKKISDFGFPDHFDIVYVNQRMADGLLAFPMSVSARKFELTSPFKASIQTLEVTGKMNAPGGEGYLLSREGARKLLDIFSRRKIYMEVDWLIFFHCLSPEQREAFIAKDATRRFDMLAFDELELKAAVASPSLLEQGDGVSTIAFDNTQNYISRADMRRQKEPKA